MHARAILEAALLVTSIFPLPEGPASPYVVQLPCSVRPLIRQVASRPPLYTTVSAQTSTVSPRSNSSATIGTFSVDM